MLYKSFSRSSNGSNFFILLKTVICWLTFKIASIFTLEWFPTYSVRSLFAHVTFLSAVFVSFHFVFCSTFSPSASILKSISNLRLTSASVDFRDMSRSLRSVKNTLIFEHFPLFRVFHLNCYLSYLQFLKLTYISFLYHCIWRQSLKYFVRVFETYG